MIEMKTIGVSGLNGFIGSNFLRHCMENIPDYDFHIINISDELETRSSNEISKYFGANHFDFIINLTHFPDDHQETLKYNNLLLFWCQMFKIPLLQLLDDKEFCNDKIQMKKNGHFIISTSNVYSYYNDKKSLLRQFYEQKNLPEFNDLDYHTDCKKLVENMVEIIQNKTFRDKSFQVFLCSYLLALNEITSSIERKRDFEDIFKEWDKEKEVYIYEIEPIIGNFRSYLDFNSDDILDLILD